ncbi:hypothetical protein PoB_005564500 [Plakobranchus ocellatus]|uniref:Uncharacterized protein n=1 Tax=Plakobranchus ocellatus TaxID=259542 RepID=A0AAV4C8U5_9GAST|nr:hypothetical protein PoB_005564500 [Plakobranchus ocellatus]
MQSLAKESRKPCEEIAEDMLNPSVRFTGFLWTNLIKENTLQMGFSREDTRPKRLQDCRHRFESEEDDDDDGSHQAAGQRLLRPRL